MGDIEMKTPELLRQSFNIEDIELESGKGQDKMLQNTLSFEN